MIKQLGYKVGGCVPAYRYRLTTSRTYTNNDAISVNYDLIELYREDSVVLGDNTPLFFLLPRPNQEFSMGVCSFTLNHNWIGRVIDHQLGGKLVSYVDYNSDYCKTYLPDDKRETGNYFDSKIKLFNGSEIMLDSAENELPLLADQSLIPDYADYCHCD